MRGSGINGDAILRDEKTKLASGRASWAGQQHKGRSSLGNWGSSPGAWEMVLVSDLIRKSTFVGQPLVPGPTKGPGLPRASSREVKLGLAMWG